MDAVQNQPSEMMTRGLVAQVVRFFFLCRIPGISTLLIWCYAKYFQANFYEHSLKDFDCLLAFFLRSRNLSSKMRGQDLISGYVSPVEGVVQFWGKLSHNSTLPIKGAGFTVSRLVGFEAPFLQSGIVFHLAPGNYHHVHAPIDMVVEDYFELPGLLRSVSVETVKNNPMLYAENYRHVLVAKSQHGERFVMVLVGAKNIGSISCPKLAGWNLGDEVEFSKGEELGFFSLGSTVVLLLDRAIEPSKLEGDCVDVIDSLFDEDKAG